MCYFFTSKMTENVPGLGERGFVWLALCVGTKP